MSISSAPRFTNASMAASCPPTWSSAWKGVCTYVIPFARAPARIITRASTSPPKPSSGCKSEPPNTVRRP
eukprot:6681788-Pyramimonas_sp.AAC.1